MSTLFETSADRAYTVKVIATGVSVHVLAQKADGRGVWQVNFDRLTQWSVYAILVTRLVGDLKRLGFSYEQQRLVYDQLVVEIWRLPVLHRSMRSETE